MSSEPKFKVGDFVGSVYDVPICRVTSVKYAYTIEYPSGDTVVRAESELVKKNETEQTAAKKMHIEKAKQKMMDAMAEWQKLQE
jgi:hypothetical protein